MTDRRNSNRSNLSASPSANPSDLFSIPLPLSGSRRCSSCSNTCHHLHPNGHQPVEVTRMIPKNDTEETLTDYAETSA
ncbi:hypothetical protein ACOMHN_057390 [Nucella lapillus]